MPRPTPLLFLLALATTAARAAISVSGIADESNYTGPRSFTVGDPAGFTTTATLNGAPVAVGVAVDVETSGFYELVVTETPDGGGASGEESFLFVLREPGRGSTESGLPPFTAVPLVDDAPSAINTGLLVAITPNAYPDDLPVPVVALLQKTNGDPLWLNAKVRIADHPASTVQVRRGFGYGFLPAGTGNVVAGAAALTASKSITIEDNTTVYTSVSGNIAADIDYGDNARLEITADVTIETDVTLTIGAGGIVRLAPGVEIDVDGTFIVNGTPANPTTFAPTTPGSPWGGFLLEGSTSDVTITGAIFHGNGADQDWFDGSGYSTHRDEQALFLCGNSDADLLLTDCYLIESDGQFLHNDDGDITLNRCLLQGATTSGQCNGGTVTIDNSALVLFPDDDPNFADGDNDAIYFTDGQHLLTNTVIGYTQDDGIDTGGSPSGYTSNSTVQSCWFESTLHEAMSNSGAKNCFAYDSVFFNNGQTMESGYGGPHSTMERCLAVANMVGARLGDNYSSNGPYTNNTLAVTDSLLLNNLYHDIWGYDWSSWTYNTDKMTVTGTKMTIAEDLARHPGNAAFDPGIDAALIAPYMPVPGSEVGIAITSTPTQSALADYPGQFIVQLSTFSSNVVTAGYSLTAKATLDGPDTTLASGTLTFDPSETKKTLDLALPAGSYALVRVALDTTSNAANTGGEAWFLDSGAAPNPTLIARGSVWNYNADRAEPAGWEGTGFDDDGWASGATPIGYGDGDEETVLTSTEYGPSGDRTTAVYFRREFEVADASAITALALELQRDDGAVVYLNGTEVTRSNFDPDIVDIEYDTLAENASNENDYVSIDLPPASLAFLQDGTNVLAVEVHQSSLTSSDLSFDLDLIADISVSSQVFDLVRFASGSYLFWPDTAALLQESDDLSNWTSLDSQSPFEIQTGEGRKFYRTIIPE